MDKMEKTGKVIRVHSVDGVVFARIMAPMTVPFEAYEFIRGIDVPTGLDQQATVDYLRGEGWTVEQDRGTDFDSPEWGA